MGYTHYFEQNRNFTDTEWAGILEFAKNMFVVMEPGILGDLKGDGDKPEATVTRIAFNGLGEEAFESFVINKKGNGFGFCKTNAKSYDIAVVAMLCYINHIASDALKIRSDGRVKDWIAGREFGSIVASEELKVPDYILEK